MKHKTISVIAGIVLILVVGTWVYVDKATRASVLYYPTPETPTTPVNSVTTTGTTKPTTGSATTPKPVSSPTPTPTPTPTLTPSSGRYYIGSGQSA